MTASSGAASRGAPGVVSLALDASTPVGTVAVFIDGDLAAEAEAAMRGGRDERLLPAVDEALRSAALAVGDVDRVLCGGGPGGFTGLRIAASIAKGIAAARRVPMFVRSSLELLVAGQRPPLPHGEYLAALDAMRGEWFAAPFTVRQDGVVVAGGPAALLGRDALAAAAAGRQARIVGPGMPLDARPHARGFAAMLDELGDERPADLDAWEPDYGRLAEAQVRWEAAHGRPLPR